MDESVDNFLKELLNLVAVLMTHLVVQLGHADLPLQEDRCRLIGCVGHDFDAELVVGAVCHNFRRENDLLGVAQQRDLLHQRFLYACKMNG